MTAEKNDSKVHVVDAFMLNVADLILAVLGVTGRSFERLKCE